MNTIIMSRHMYVHLTAAGEYKQALSALQDWRRTVVK
jgi:hypothetical protein